MSKCVYIFLGHSVYRKFGIRRRPTFIWLAEQLSRLKKCIKDVGLQRIFMLFHFIVLCTHLIVSCCNLYPKLEKNVLVFRIY